jgi:hypothetical protein
MWHIVACDKLPHVRQATHLLSYPPSMEKAKGELGMRIFTRIVPKVLRKIPPNNRGKEMLPTDRASCLEKGS